MSTVAIISSALSLVGLAVTAVGAWTAAKAVILTEEQALTIGSPRYASVDPEKNLNLPMVQSLIA